MVIFIRRREDYYGKECNSGAPPEAIHPSTQGTKKQSGENGIFSQVRGFAHKQMNLSDVRGRDGRLEPEEERRDKTRGVFSRHQIGRAENHERHPEYDGSPGVEKAARIQTAKLGAARRVTRSGSFYSPWAPTKRHLRQVAIAIPPAILAVPQCDQFFSSPFSWNASGVGGVWRHC